MECERVREEFVERLTGTLDPTRSRAIDDHIAGCAACRAETDRLRELWTELGALRVPAASGAAGRIERMLDARAASAQDVGMSPVSTPARSGRVRQIVVSAVGLAAALILGVALGQRSANGSRAAVSATPAIATPSTPKEKYVLLLHGPARARRLTPQQAAADSATERALVAEYSAWAGRLAAAGSLVMAEKLADDPLTMLAASGARELPRFTADELGGFFVIQASDSAEAFRIARECPHLRHGGTVQVRRIEPT
jgi:hypothetical protein